MSASSRYGILDESDYSPGERASWEDGVISARGRTLGRRGDGKGRSKGMGPAPDQVPYPEALSSRSASEASKCSDSSGGSKGSKGSSSSKGSKGTKGSKGKGPSQSTSSAVDISSEECSESNESGADLPASGPSQPMFTNMSRYESIGSLLHNSGQCTPCDRWMKKRCVLGGDCPQCHMLHPEIPKASRNRPSKQARNKRDKTKNKLHRQQNLTEAEDDEPNDPLYYFQRGNTVARSAPSGLESEMGSTTTRLSL